MDFLFFIVSCIFFIQQFVNVEAKVQVRSSKNILNADFDDRKITETAIIHSQLRNEIQCTSWCHNTKNCRSWSYKKVTQICVLFDKDFVDVRSTANEVEAGWQYWHLIKEQQKADCVGQTYLVSVLCDVSELASICESYSGGELVKIDRGLKQYCVEQLLENKSNGEVFIQGKKNESDNKWRYDDQMEMTYFNWNIAGGQPNNRPNEIYLGVRKINGYVWHDVFDVDLNAAVCQQT